MGRAGPQEFQLFNVCSSHLPRSTQVALAENENSRLPPLPDRLRFGVHAITPSNDGTFGLSETGVRAVILAIAEYGDVLDLVAWPCVDPSRWWLRFRNADILGGDVLHHAAWTGGTVALFPTPWAWLQAAGRGVCIIDWTADLTRLFDGVIVIQPTTRTLEFRFRARIRELLQPTFRVKRAP